MSTLYCKSLYKSFSGLEVLKGVSLTAHSGEITGLIGPNGAGKTTLFNCLAKDIPLEAGNILMGDNDITDSSLSAYDLGITRTFQHVKIVSSLSSLDNVLFGADKKNPLPLYKILLPKWLGKQDSNLQTKAHNLLKQFKVPEPYQGDIISRRPLIELRKIELARALISSPKVVLLDEPVAGLNPNEKKEMSNLITSCIDKAIFILVEHDLHFVKQICSVIQVLNDGKIIAAGYANEVMDNKAVKQAYLGET